MTSMLNNISNQLIVLMSSQKRIIIKYIYIIMYLTIFSNKFITLITSLNTIKHNFVIK